MKRTVLLALLCAATAFAAPAASLVEGRIYLKNGTVVECTGNDRIKLPKKSGPLKLFRDAFRRTKTKEVFRADSVDSVVCWHPKTPEYLRKFIPAADPGWMWVYLETPYIRVCVWSKKGYGSTPTEVSGYGKNSGLSVSPARHTSCKSTAGTDSGTWAAPTVTRRTPFASVSPAMSTTIPHWRSVSGIRTPAVARPC